MSDMKSQIQEAYDMVDRRQSDAALKVIDDLLANLSPPNRMEIPAARPTIFDHLQTARRALAGEHEIVPPKAALRSALALVH
jgi:hypothetical protein